MVRGGRIFSGQIARNKVFCKKEKTDKWTNTRLITLKSLKPNLFL